jgi:hypothetical protein
VVKVTAEWLNLDEAFASLEAECAQVIRGMSISMWKAILRYTPQFSGGMAASWSYSIGAPVYADRSDQVSVSGDAMPPIFHRKGDPEAIAVANSQGVSRAPFKLGETVYIANGVGHAEAVESGDIRLRFVNMPGRPMMRGLALVSDRYSVDVSRAAAGQLKRLNFS